MTKLSRNDMAIVRRIVTTLHPLQKKRDLQKKKIKELVAELEATNAEIKFWEDKIMEMTGWYSGEITKVKEVNGKKSFFIEIPEGERPSDKDENKETFEESINTILNNN